MSTVTEELQTAPIIDVDSHIIEPADLWTSRLPTRMSDVAPRVIWDEALGEERWQIADIKMGSAAHLSVGGWHEPPPFFPRSIAESVPSGYDAKARLEWLDEQGILAQVLYPNLLGFDAHVFLQLGTDVALACVQAYNDFMTEWCSADPDRLIPIMSLPFWDIDAAITEMERCHEAGHRGILLANNYERVGFPNVTTEVWAPLLARAEERELSINFHIGFSKRPVEELEPRYQKYCRGSIEALDEEGFRKFVMLAVSTPGFISNAQAITDVICTGLCQRYPGLKIVSVESGFGYIPFLLQSLDWQWANNGIARVDPSFELIPSEYFKRQIFATFWFERPNPGDLVALQDNAMFETDFPHPTSLSPGPWCAAPPPRQLIVDNLSELPADVAHKVLHGNAAKLYKIPDRA